MKLRTKKLITKCFAIASLFGIVAAYCCIDSDRVIAALILLAVCAPVLFFCGHKLSWNK